MRSKLAPMLLLIAGLGTGSVASEPVQIVTSMVAPWGYRSATGRPDGLLVKLADLLAREAGLPYQQNLRPYPRVLQEISAGRADMAVLFDSPESEKIAEPLGKVLEISIVVIGPAGTPALEDMGQLSGQRAGYIRGSKYGSAFDDNRTLIKIPLNTPEQGLAMLLQGRLDVMVISDHTLRFALQKMGLTAERVSLRLRLAGTSASLYFSRLSPRQDLRSTYRRALAQLRERGLIAPIFNPAEPGSAELRSVSGSY